MKLSIQQVNTICTGDQEIADFIHAPFEQNQKPQAVVDT